jgi:hypothetical protein
MNTKRTRITIAAGVAVVAMAIGGTIVVTSATTPGGSAPQPKPRAANLHVEPGGGGAQAPEFSREPDVQGTTPSGVRYTIAVSPDKGNTMLCYEISHAQASSSGCGLPSPTSEQAVAVPAAFGDDTVIFALVTPDVDRIEVGRADGSGDVTRAAAEEADGHRIAHAVLRVPQSEGSSSDAEPPYGTTSAPPIPPTLSITTRDRAGNVLERRSLGQR